MQKNELLKKLKLKKKKKKLSATKKRIAEIFTAVFYYNDYQLLVHVSAWMKNSDVKDFINWCGSLKCCDIFPLRITSKKQMFKKSWMLC